MTDQAMAKFACPICKRALSHAEAQEGPFAPFCSERCRLVDLGHWLGGNYAVPGELTPAAEDAEQQGDSHRAG